ncbi:MAG: hypothetical protein ACK4TA_06720 [Saprospiraceae bacterium]
MPVWKGNVNNLRFTIYDLRFTIYDLRFTIYDFMDVKDLKLNIINQVIATEDVNLLQTIFKLLELNTTEAALSELAGMQQQSNITDAAIQSLQQDINAIFEIKTEP